MSLHTRKEFAELCGVSEPYLNNYIKRGKVVLTRNKVDDTIADNREFMEARIGKQKIKAAEVETVKLNPDQEDEVKNLSVKQKRANLRKTVAEADKKELEAQKLRGEAIPIDLTKNIISQLSQSFITSFRDLAEGYMLEVAHEAKFSNKKVAEFRVKLVDGINETMETAVEVASKDLKKLAAEFAVRNKR